jgi:Domain of unknown function (DUF5615)
VSWPPVYLDECVDVALADVLRERGFTATLARDHGPRGASDEAQLVYASGRGWLILSHNTRHFQRWHKVFIDEGRPHGGIMLIPETGPLSRLAIRTALLLDWIGLQGDWRSRLFTWGQLQFQLTQGYRLPIPKYREDDVRHALGQTRRRRQQ